MTISNFIPAAVLALAVTAAQPSPSSVTGTLMIEVDISEDKKQGDVGSRRIAIKKRANHDHLELHPRRRTRVGSDRRPAIALVGDGHADDRGRYLRGQETGRRRQPPHRNKKTSKP